LLQPLRQGQPVDMSLGNIGAAVGCFADVVDGSNAGVTNLGHSAGTVNQTAGKAVVLRHARTQDIESHQAIVIDVVGLIQIRVSLLGDALFYLILI